METKPRVASSRKAGDGPASYFLEYVFGTQYYDKYLSRDKVVHFGGLSASDRVAIYLIFPAKWVIAITSWCFEISCRKRLRAVGVSNVKLSEMHRALLSQHCWRFIERPNFGYDFGGYRDGVLYVLDTIKDLKYLAFFNDSTWFPLPNSENWLATAEALNVDFAGAASNYGAARVDVDKFREIEWKYSADHKNFHYCSFALLFSSRVIQDPRFLAFWQKIHLSQSKKRTVRRGEIGLTQWVLRQGYSHGVTCDISDLDVQLATLSDTRLHELVHQVLIPEDPKILAIKNELLWLDNSTKEWKQAARQFIMTAVVRQGSSYSLAAYTIQEKKFPFLKKSPTWLNDDASRITIDIARRLEGDFGKNIWEEAIALRTRLEIHK